MSADKRRDPRRYVVNGARISREGSTDLQDCLMIDVSAFGARLELKKGGSIPDQFMLLLSHDGKLSRQCSVVWRSENAIGIKFSPPFPTKVKRRK